MSTLKPPASVSDLRTDGVMTSAHVDWWLAITRLGAIRRRLEREGLTPDVEQAFAESQGELVAALKAIADERLEVLAAAARVIH